MPADLQRKGTDPILLHSSSLALFVAVQSFCGRLRYNGGVSFRTRDFRRADFEILWRIDQACFDPQLAYSRLELAFYMRRPGAFTLVAEVEGGEDSGNGRTQGRIVGFIVAEVRRRTAHIITIDVVAGARRGGVGSTLLRAAEARLQQAGATAVELETPVNNAAAIQFYKEMGYFVEKTITGYYSNQIDALVMRKDLTVAPVR
jgi:ribosomal-protein-alanine N-acetyltransferase